MEKLTNVNADDLAGFATQVYSIITIRLTLFYNVASIVSRMDS